MNVPQVVLGMVLATSMEVVRVIVIIMVTNARNLIQHVSRKVIVNTVDAVLKNNVNAQRDFLDQHVKYSKIVVINHIVEIEEHAILLRIILAINRLVHANANFLSEMKTKAINVKNVSSMAQLTL